MNRRDFLKAGSVLGMALAVAPELLIQEPKSIEVFGDLAQMCYGVDGPIKIYTNQKMADLIEEWSPTCRASVEVYN